VITGGWDKKLLVFEVKQSGESSLIQSLTLDDVPFCGLVDGDSLYIGCVMGRLYKYGITTDDQHPLTLLKQYQVSSHILKMIKIDHIIFIG
jgi:hypothetical protein